LFLSGRSLTRRIGLPLGSLHWRVRGAMCRCTKGVVAIPATSAITLSDRRCLRARLTAMDAVANRTRSVTHVQGDLPPVGSIMVCPLAGAGSVTLSVGGDRPWPGRATHLRGSRPSCDLDEWATARRGVGLLICGFPERARPGAGLSVG
jgi:hypothetical protein